MESLLKNMPTSLEKGLKKQAKKRGLSNNYHTELCFLYDRQLWCCSNWGIVIKMLPPKKSNGTWGLQPYSQKDLSKLKVSTSEPLVFSSPWDCFDIIFLKDRKIQINSIDDSDEKIGFSSHSPFSKLGIDYKGNKELISFSDNGIFELLEATFKKYKM